MESITNKTIFHDYEILETWTAGIVLSGPEVKSVKQQKLDLKGSYVNLDAKQELWLINCHIAPYPPAIQVQTNYQPTHSRKLLLTKKEIKTLIGRAKSDARKQKAYPLTDQNPKGKRDAITEFKVVKRFEDYTLLEIQIKTGRRHQIRCHLSYLQHPIAGDKLYGFKNQPTPENLTRQFLHASYLKIQLPASAGWPNGKTEEFKSELPEDLKKVLEKIK